jgi:molecular chaperone GrpE
MVAGQLEGVLQRHHCQKIEAMGQPFDPNLHEAIFQQPSDDHAPNTVVGEAQTGFRLHDRVVRPSQVVVSGAASGEKEPARSEPEDEQGEPATSEGNDNDAHV